MIEMASQKCAQKGPKRSKKRAPVAGGRAFIGRPTQSGDWASLLAPTMVKAAASGGVWHERESLEAWLCFELRGRS